MSQGEVLTYIEENQPVTMNELSNGVGNCHSVLYITVKALEKQGLIIIKCISGKNVFYKKQ